MKLQIKLPQPFIMEFKNKDGSTQMEVVTLIKQLPNGFLALRSDDSSVVIPYRVVAAELEDT